MERKRNDTVAPSYLVLHKLKQWDESQTHAHNNPGSNVQSAHLERVRKQLFTMLSTLRYTTPKFRHDPTYDPNLHNESAPRVDRFLAAHHCYAKEWKEMGFPPSEGSSRPSRQREYSVMQIRSFAANTTVAILAKLNLPCAIFGSMACKLYGNQRVPNVRSFFLSSKFTLITGTCNWLGHRHPRPSASRACFNYTGRD